MSERTTRKHPKTSTAVVLLESIPAPPGLMRAALRSEWDIVPDGVRNIRRARAAAGMGRPAFLVHSCAGGTDAIEAIAALRQARWCAGVIAVGDATHATLEVAARAAGATCFLDESGPPEAFERAVAQMLSVGRTSRGGAFVEWMFG
jgi:DNA-binding NarL/FixJ family response regulator